MFFIGAVTKIKSCHIHPMLSKLDNHLLRARRGTQSANNFCPSHYVEPLVYFFLMIDLKGVSVHNLKNISLKLKQGQLIVFTGVSGSGKSSLAFDTIYVEGQRRYIDSLSAHARRHRSEERRVGKEC